MNCVMFAGENCGVKPSLCDVRCTWCDRTVHDKCKDSESEECDLGKYKNLILPPNSLRLKLVGWKGRRHWSVAEIVDPPVNVDWSPLIVLANRESGNQEGEVILRAFRSLLNPAQVNSVRFTTCMLAQCTYHVDNFDSVQVTYHNLPAHVHVEFWS